MQKYLVGGAVRDKLLGREVKDRDWVVVNSSPEEMLKLGFSKVGADFPVFLHPESNEEYALARVERKDGHGYHGFSADWKNVSLEEDLSRRDLSINAMAEDEDGNIIDPFRGMDDLVNKKLRAVSPAFKEDPVRALRAIRFLARFGPEWSLDPLLEVYIHEMLEAKEFDHIPAERFVLEMEKALSEEHWQLFFSHPLVEEIMVQKFGRYMEAFDLEEGHWLVQLADARLSQFFRIAGFSSEMIMKADVAESVHLGEYKALLAMHRRKPHLVNDVVHLFDPALADRLSESAELKFADFHEKGQDPRESRLAMEDAQLEIVRG